MDTVTETLRVFRRAAGFRRDQTRARGAARLHLVPANAERLHRSLNGGVANSARSRHALAQTDDPGKGIDDTQTFARRARDQQSAIIGAQIESGIGVIAPGRASIVMGSKGV